MILNANQERQNNRDVTLEEYLLNQKAAYEANHPFQEEVNLLIGNIALVKPLLPVKETKGAYITKSKKQIKAALAADANNVCTSATAYAVSIADAGLQQAVRYRTWDIRGARDGDVTGIIAVITGALTPLVNIEAFRAYGINAENLQSLTTQAQDFDDSRGKAKVIDTSSSIANGDLNNIFKAIRANIVRLRLLLPHIGKTAPAFVTGFNTSAAIDNSGVHHNGIEGIVTNPLTGRPVEGATITGQGKNKVAKTDKKGYYKLICLKVTDMTITVTAPGYDVQTFDVKIVRSRIIACNISLTGKVISLAATA